MKSRNTFRNWVEYATLRSVQALVTAFPIRWVGGALRGVLYVVFGLFWPLKSETVSRVREVFGQETPISRIRFIARRSVWNLMMNFVELFHAGRMDLDYLQTHLEGTDKARAKLRAIIDKYGGAVIALPHMGNWDLAGVACSRFGIPLMALARAQNNPYVEAWMQRNRLDNFEALDRRYTSAFVRIVHHLKGGGAFAILPDVRHNKPAVPVTVFGKPDVQLGKGVSKFARMANVPIVPFFMERLDADHHRLHLGEPIFPDLEADADADAVRITQQVWDLFEAKIREQPEQWFWFNRRWILTPLYTQTRHKHGS